MLAGFLGIFLEFLDFTLYGYSAAIIAHNFFPVTDSALNYVWLIFAGGFLFRLLGTLVFGYLGDTRGVKFTLTYSIVLMAIATTGIGLLPTYSSAGIWAPLGLLVLRCLQGFAVSPEYNGVAIYLSKDDKYKKHFCFLSSITVTMAGLGMLTGGSIVSYLTKGYEIANLPEWRWRLPFIASGIILGSIIFWLRRSMKEQSIAAGKKVPLLKLLAEDKTKLLITTLTVGLVGIITYSLNGYIGAFLQTARGYSFHEAIMLVSGNSLILCVAILISGFLGDKFGRDKILRTAIVCIAIGAPFIFHFISMGSPAVVKYSIIVLAALLGFISGVIPAFLALSYSDAERYTGASIAYNFGMSCFGGITPWLMTNISQHGHILPGVLISSFSILLLACYFILNRKK